MEILTIRMSMQHKLPVEQRQTLPQVMRSLGVSGCYTGWRATFARDLPFSIIFFPFNTFLKKQFADETGQNSIMSLLGAGLIAGCVASGSVTPADVVKTR